MLPTVHHPYHPQGGRRPLPLRPHRHCRAGGAAADRASHQTGYEGPPEGRFRGEEVRKTRLACFKPDWLCCVFYPQFTPGADISRDSFYNPSPVAADQVDVAVCVFPMDIAFPPDDKTLDKIKVVLLEARDLSELLPVPLPLSLSTCLYSPICKINEKYFKKM